MSTNAKRGEGSIAGWRCPRCGNHDELRVLPGELGFGYPQCGRFAVLDRLRVPGLRRHRRDLRLDIALHHEVWRVPTRLRQMAAR